MPEPAPSTPHHPNLDVALAAAEAGFPVGPCNPETKVPLIDKGLKPKNGAKWADLVPPWLYRDGPCGGHLRATCHPGAVRSYWRLHPDAIPLIVIPPGKIVIDVDEPAKFPAGLLEGLRKAAALIVTTPGGGEHLWFRTFDGAKQGPLSGDEPHPERTGWNVHLGDLKVTASGYVFPPGARRKDGRTYTATRGTLGTELTDVPPDLLEQLRALRDRSPKRGRARRLTPRQLATMPADSGRNNAFNAAVFAEAREGRLTPDREREWRHAAAQAGLGQSEVDKTFRSARDAGRARAAAERKPPKKGDDLISRFTLKHEQIRHMLAELGEHVRFNTRARRLERADAEAWVPVDDRYEATLSRRFGDRFRWRARKDGGDPQHVDLSAEVISKSLLKFAP